MSDSSDIFDREHDLRDAIKDQNHAKIVEVLRATASEAELQYLLEIGLLDAVRAGQHDLVKYFAEKEKASVDAVYPVDAAHNPSIPILQILLDNGWDINRTPDTIPTGGHGPVFLQLICHDSPILRWCLAHGASVDEPDLDPYRPPLLDSIACHGSVDDFKYLLKIGAKLGPRVLHKACEAAAAAPKFTMELAMKNPINWNRSVERVRMLDYLVNDLHLDINALDTESKLPNHYGTPIMYAIISGSASGTLKPKVLDFLLQQGADLTIKDCHGMYNAITLAKQLTAQNATNKLLGFSRKRHELFFGRPAEVEGRFKVELP